MYFKPNCTFVFHWEKSLWPQVKILRFNLDDCCQKRRSDDISSYFTFLKISTKLQHFDQWYVVCWYSLYIYSGCYSEVWICIWLFTRPSHSDTGWVRFCGLQFKTDTDLVDWLLTLNNAGQATKVWNVIFTHGAGCERTRGWQQLRAHGSGYKFLWIPEESHLKSSASLQCQRKSISFSTLDLPDLRGFATGISVKLINSYIFWLFLVVVSIWFLCISWITGVTFGELRTRFL